MTYAAAAEHLATPVNVLAYAAHIRRLRASRAIALGRAGPP